MRRMLSLLVTAVVLGCAPTQTEVVSSAASDEAVYTTLLSAAFRGTLPDTLLLTDSSAQFRVPREVESEWRRAFDAIPGDLRTALERLSVVRKPTRNLALPRPVRLVSERELEEIFQRGPEQGWEELYRRYPRMRQYLSASPVAYSADGEQALVYLERHCGSLCGSGDIVWLVRGSTVTWRIQRVFNVWFS